MNAKQWAFKLAEISSGWKNLVWKNKEVEELAVKRISICVQCPHLNPDNKCNLCGCYTPAKVRSKKSKCPDKRW